VNEHGFREQVERETVSLELDLKLLEAGGQVDAVGFAARYRLLCERLAIANHRGYGADLSSFLNDLALRSHAQLYRHAAAGDRDDLAEHVLAFPRALRAHARSQLTSLALFLAPAIGAYLTILASPDLVHHFMDLDQAREMEAMYDPQSAHFLKTREAGDDLTMFGFYIYNNISIALRTFASGLVFGLGSAFFVFYNGLVLGSVAGHLVHVGSSATFFPFVIGHGALELPALVIAGGTGLALGHAILSPGEHTRVESLQRAARAAVPIVYGFTSMLLGAAFLEAFWSSKHILGDTVRYAVGAGLWVAVLAYLLGAGRKRAART
jgi:uncharacterized membrane protein SpoIIM required for sporulation